MKKLLLSSVAIVALAAPALAADLPARPVYKGAAPAAVVAAYNWSGFYLGIQGGIGRARSDWTFTGLPVTDITGNGALFGGTVGFNIQTGAIVFGVEADGSWANLNLRTNSDSGVFVGTCAGGLGCRADLRSLITARGRVGFTTGPWLFYGTGGWATGKIDFAIPTGATGSPTPSGWAAGAGIEWMLAQNWTVKAEYLHFDLGSPAACPVGAAVGCAAPGTFATFRGDIVRAGLNYKFGWGGPVVARY